MKRFVVAICVLLAFCIAAVVPVSPQGALDVWDGLFIWTGVEGATWYLLEVWQGGTRVYRQWYEMTCADCSVTVDTIPPGAYRWQVLDWGAYGYGTWAGADFSFNELQITPAPPPPTEWHVPGDGTFAEAMGIMTDCGTIYIDTDLAETAIVYGDNRAASFIVPDYGCDWTFIGIASRPVITFDPAAPPYYYDGPGIVFLIKNSETTTIENLHFIGTRDLGDNVDALGNPVDKDITVLLDAPGDLVFRNNELEKNGHAGLKHSYGSGTLIVENNVFHDSGFTSRDHHTYLPGGADYTLRYNHGWNATGYCIGYGVVYPTYDAEIYGNSCINNGGGISIGPGLGANVHDNFVFGNDRNLWLSGGGGTFANNVLMGANIEDVYSERSCGAIVTNWCANPVPNNFYDNGNIYEIISHPDRIE